MSRDSNVFGPATRAVVIGATGALGAAFCDLFSSTLGFQVTRLSRSGSDIRLDVTDEESIGAAAAQLAAQGDADMIVNCAGILHDGEEVAPEKTFKQLNASTLEAYFRINAIGPALILKHFTPLMPRGRKAVFASLSARVGSMGDNRLGGWYGYRASKAAHNMILRTGAIELARTHPLAVCTALHPGTVDSPLSAPYAKGHTVFSPKDSASRLFTVMQSLEPEDSGGFFAYDGSPISW